MNHTDVFHPLDYSAAGIAALTALLIALCLPLDAIAAHRAGTVIAATGHVVARHDNAKPHRLGRGDAVQAGDTIVTGDNGKAQIRFVDDGMVSLAPGTRFRVDRYQGKNGSGSVVMSFFRGAMRTITGAISHDKGEHYQMKTPVATIGVRGTAYALRYCSAQCGGRGEQNQLYGRVDKGSIDVENANGSTVIGNDQFFAASQDSGPRRIVAPPDGVLNGSRDTTSGSSDTGNDDSDKPQQSGQESGAAGTEQSPSEQTGQPPSIPVSNGGETTGQPTNDLLTPNFESGDQVSRTGQTGQTDQTGQTGDSGNTSPPGTIAVAVANDNDFPLLDKDLLTDDSDYAINDAGQVIAATLHNPSDGYSSDSPRISVDRAATLAESGTTLGVQWGRWDNNISAEYNDDYNPTLSTGNFAYAVANNLTTPTQLSSMTGEFLYSIAGGPKAFDETGNTWTVNALNLYISFDNGGYFSGADLSLSKDANGATPISFSGSGDSSVDLTNNQLSATLESFSGDATAKIKGRFIGVNADGAIVVFTADDLPDGPVAGTKILEKGGMPQ